VPAVRLRAVVALVVALLAVGGCTVTSTTSRCVGGVCDIEVSGERSVEVEFGSFERDLWVGPIEADAVTVSVGAEQARLAVGQQAALGGLLVRLVALSGSDVRFEVRRS
jgi:hypothetical protein